MKKRFWLLKRGSVFNVQDTESGAKECLHTTDRKEVERLRVARSEAAQSPLLGLNLAKAYLSASDPMLEKCTWKFVMEEFYQHERR